MSVANVPLLGAVAATAAAIPAGLYFGSTTDIKPETPSAVTPKTELVSLKDENEFQDTDNKTKFGGKFAYYFLTDKEGVNTTTWNERLTEFNKKKDSLQSDSFFTTAKTEPSVAKLKTACKTQYGQEVPTADAEKWAEVWTYCSVMGAKPTLIKDSTEADEAEYKSDQSGGTEKLGKKLKDTVISTHSSKNNDFWNLRETEFKAGYLNSDVTSAYFSKTKSQSIKDLCQEAYKKQAPSQAGTAENPSEDEIKKFCSVEKVS